MPTRSLARCFSGWLLLISSQIQRSTLVGRRMISKEFDRGDVRQVLEIVVERSTKKFRYQGILTLMHR